MTKIQLSDHFTFPKLLRFALPSILMLIMVSLYSIVDGFFISNFVGKTSFAAINLIYPALMAVGTVGFMIGTGGCAVVSRSMGENDYEKANRYFSLFIYFSLVASIILSVAGFLFMRPIARMLGASGDLLQDCVSYGRILFIAMPAFILQCAFPNFLVAAEKPNLNLAINIAAGLSNIILDYLLIVKLHWGLSGAAVATGIGQVIGGVAPLIYFLCRNNSRLRLTKPELNARILLTACGNGSSEMVSNLAASVVGILYNFQLMRLAGEDGVAAYGMIQYINFIFTAIFMGFSTGSAPIVSYHYGAKNDSELQNLFRKSQVFLIISGIVLCILAQASAEPLVAIFVGKSAALVEMTTQGVRLFSISFLIMGFNIWSSSFFTALNDGKNSALISFFRTFLFQVVVICTLPKLLDLTGVWLSAFFAEGLSLFVTVFLLIKNKKQYHYV